MKKVLFFASALAGLFFAASCQQETLEPEQMSKTVTFTVEAPGALATKSTTINEKATIADGTNVNEVHYEVYKNVEGVDHALLDAHSEPMAKGVVEMANKKANVTLDLLQDQEYTVIFWAQVKDAGHYDTSDLRCIELASSAKANDETRAAFFKRFDFDTYQHRDYPQIDLRRPFAQLNLLTTMESLKPVSTGQTSGYEIDAKTSKVIVTGLAASFNTVTGVGNYVDYPYTFNMYDTPEEQGQATLKVNGKDYHYVSMNYMFVPVNAEDGSATVDIDYEIVTDKGSIQHEIANVPIRENYRTNVIGNLFTKESKFEIFVDANFDGQELVEVWDGREVSEPEQVDGKYVISTAAELAWLSAAVNGTLPPVAVNGVAQPTPAPQKFSGKTFMLLEDIDLANPAIELPDVTWTPIGANGKFEGTFDGNGKTIRNLVVSTEGKAAAGLFANAKYVKNLTVDGATVTGQYKTGVIVGDGLCSRIDNCHVINATVTVTPYNKDEANNVGGIVGYLSAENEAWVKNCSVVDSEISGYRKVGGIAGAANQAAVVTGNTVANSTITADQTAEYIKNNYDGNAGVFAGFIDANANVSGNTEGENVVVKRYVDSTEELEHAVADAQSGDTIYIGNAEVTMPYFKSKALNFEGINANAVVKQSPAAHNDKYYEGSELNFKDLTLVGTSYKNNTQGFQQSVKETYDGCSFLNYYMFAGDETIVNDCTFTNVGQYFWTGTADEITFNRCTFSGTERAVKVCTVGNNGDRIATFNDCEFTAETQVKSAIEIDGSKGSTYKVYINNCTDTGFAAGEFTGETMFNIEGKENVEVYVDGILFEFPVNDYVENGNTYEVYSAEGLAKYAYMVNNVDKTLNVKLMSDIQLPAYEIAVDEDAETYYFTDTPITVENGIPSGSNWIPIGEYDTSKPFYGFYGNIDGNEFTVKGLRIKANGVATGFVGYAETETASICNLNIDDAIVYNTIDYTGVLVGWAGDGVVIRNCHLTNVHVTGKINVGGITSYSITRGKKGNGQTNLIENCSVDATSTITGTTYVGGITGHNYGSVIRSCFNAATVSGTSIVGGIAGRSRDYTKEKDAWIIGCGNEGHIVGNSSVGGVVGQIYEDNSHTNAETYTVACYTNAQTADYQNIIIGECVRTTTQYASWGIKTSESQTPAQSGSYSACYAYDSVADITQSDIDAMNAKIDEYNVGRNPEDITYCPYKWTWTPGNIPVLQ